MTGWQPRPGSLLDIMDDGAPARASECAPGAIHFRGYLTAAEQLRIAEQCLAFGAGDAGFYTPVVRGGHPMSVRMLCLGRHWNARTYTYEDVRSDVDGRPVPAMPPPLADLAARAAHDAGFVVAPDICIVNWYVGGSRMGLHQDRDESAGSLAAGLPVISFSVGDSAVFLLGGMRRRDPVQRIVLESGDVFVFGAASRLRYHGVSRILPGSAPPGLPFEGRLNLTFRKF